MSVILGLPRARAPSGCVLLSSPRSPTSGYASSVWPASTFQLVATVRLFHTEPKSKGFMLKWLGTKALLPLDSKIT